MLRSFLPTFTVAIALTFGVVSCSTQTPHSSLPLATVRTATMDITPGIEVLTRVALPDGFVPSADYPPMWLQAGQEVGIVGTQNGHALVMGYGGIGYRTARVIAQDGGVGAPDASIVDLAPSPNGMVLALEKSGLIRRAPGRSRSIVVLVDPQALPLLQPSQIQPVKTTVTRY